MNQICKQCGVVYESKRSSSKFCSASCRKLAFQVSVPEVSVPEVFENANSGGMTPEGWSDILPANYGEEDCACLHCQQNGGKKILNHGVYKDFSVLGENEINRVSLPGDVDYCGYMLCQI